MSSRTRFSASFSPCLGDWRCRMASDCTTGRPALMTVANWREKMVMSRTLGTLPKSSHLGSLISALMPPLGALISLMK